MALKSFRNTGRRAALFAGLALLALPGVAMADQDENDRGGRHHGGGEARGDAGASGWRQQAEPQQQQPARAEPAQRSWRGPATSGGWSRPASPAGQAVAAPQPQAQSGWNSDGGRRRGGDNGGNWRGNGASSGAVATTYPSWRSPEQRIESHTDDTRDRGGSYRGAQHGDQAAGGWRDRNGRNDNWNNNRNHGAYGDNHHRWDNNWRRDNRYDWSSYRNHNRDAFRWGSYYSPYRNYSYQRLSIGFFLDSMFYSSNYWINDPWQYRLPDAYGPYRWVRYYDDALLVDIYSGEVVDVIHDFFW